ncbi:MAG: TetM/TetW/TetO/TetS family tetracycline resistance ribosomal protection protein [Actinomycetota bacterium]|nr:TetM/TetW/TetO/TetS family tetracycline resistance ribosomal protection protein [Actinomycetota bacterium]
MLRRTLNLGILAHVDAGKTTLTERLLYAAGVIDEIGSVDKGTTQTDTLELERERGITIRSAVVSFSIDDVTVNLIDTPGHPDFIAEVERVLAVLDGAVLVVSAVEGVQPQTRILMRALRRLEIPTLIFVNKIDRVGADCERVLAEIQKKLTPARVAMTTASSEGSRAAYVRPRVDGDADFRSRVVDMLAENDESLLSAYVDDEAAVSSRRLRDALAAQTAGAHVHPAYCGSALTGAGVETLTAGIAELLPARVGDADGPASGLVFKIERGPAGDRIAYVRIFSGTVGTRDRVHFGPGGEGKVTAIRVFDDGADVQRRLVSAGEIGKLWGLAEIQIGDSIGDQPVRAMTHEFPPPTLEAVAEPVAPDDRQRLRVALAELAEQDPLINVRQDDERHEISVSLYGEVQKEVIQATLAREYGVDVEFRETTTIHIERLTGSGEAVELLRAKTKTNVTGKSSPMSSNPFPATLGLRVEPSAAGSGIEFRLDVDVRLVPIYIYKRVDLFVDHMAQYVRETLQEGLYGWQVTDCAVTMTDCGYRAPGTTAGDFRKLTPLVLMQALEQAGTVVCQPTVRILLEIPTDTVGAVMAALARLGAAVETTSLNGELAVIVTVVPSVRMRDLRRQLPGLTHGEGVLESSFEGYEPVVGEPPTRRRTTPNPLSRDEYIAHVAGRAVAGDGTSGERVP